MKRRVFSALASLFASTAWLCGCGAPDARGSLVVWYQASRALALAPAASALALARPALVGSWDGWRERLTDWQARRGPDGAPWLRLEARLPAGAYDYAILVGDTLIPDEENPETAFIADPGAPERGPFAVEVSHVEVAAPDAPALLVERFAAGAGWRWPRVSTTAEEGGSMPRACARPWSAGPGRSPRQRWCRARTARSRGRRGPCHPASTP